MPKTSVQSLVENIKGLAKCGARFCSLVYESKGSGEIARHNVVLGVSLENAYREDLAMLRAKLPTLSGYAAVACDELIASLSLSLEKGIGNNDAYTCAETYVTIAPGVKLHVDNGELHIYGFTNGKTVLAEGVHKTVKSSPKTLAKKALQKEMKTGKFRQFALSALEVCKMQGETLVFE